MAFVLSVPSSGVAAQEPPRVAVREFEIPSGTTTADPLRFLRVDRAGRIHVVRKTGVQVLDSTGKRLFEIAPDAPGVRPAIKTIVATGFVADTFWVCDASTRVILFGADGRYKRSFPVDSVEWSDGRRAAATVMSVTAMDALLSQRSLLKPLMQDSRPEDFAWRIFRATKTGTLLNNLGERPFGLRLSAPDDSLELDRPVATSVGVSTDGAALIFAKPLVGEQSGGAASVTVLRPAGDTVYGVRVPIPTTAFSPGSLDASLRLALPGCRRRRRPESGPILARRLCRPSTRPSLRATGPRSCC
jgi:hypothetical protein